MTPFEIEIILHYYCRADEYRDGEDFSAPAVRGILDNFLKQEVLALEDDAKRERAYKLGPCGEAYVAALLALPLPVKRWVMP